MNIAHYHNHSHDSDFTKLKTRAWAMGHGIETAIKKAGSFHDYLNQLPTALELTFSNTTDHSARQTIPQAPGESTNSLHVHTIRAIYYNTTESDFDTSQAVTEDGTKLLPTGYTVYHKQGTDKAMTQLIETSALALDEQGHGFGDLFTEYDPLRILILTKNEDLSIQQNIKQAIIDAVVAEELPEGALSRIAIESYTTGS